MHASPDCREPAGPLTAAFRPGGLPGDEPAPSAPPSRRILLVDDEEKVIAAMRRLLRRESYELLTANSGPEAIALLEAGPVQLIISDHRMPGMTGVELLREVRSRWPDILRIILSGYSDVNTIISAVNEGEIYKFITKPWNDEEIKLHVRRAIEQHDLQEENRRMAREIADQNERLRALNVLLEQSADDASTGLTSTQAVLEAVGVGLITVDSSELVVAANRRASALVSADRADLIGIPAQVALPPVLYDFVRAARWSTRDAAIRLCLEDRRLQCRVSPLHAAGGRRGNIITLWEEIG